MGEDKKNKKNKRSEEEPVSNCTPPLKKDATLPIARNPYELGVILSQRVLESLPKTIEIKSK